MSREFKLIQPELKNYYSPGRRPPGTPATLRKPMYARVEGTCYGRRQYFPMDYTSPKTHAIFEVPTVGLFRTCQE